VLSLTLDRTTVASPDSLTGQVRATDPDGIDSLWMFVDTTSYGVEGFFNTVVDGPFNLPVPGGLAGGTPLAVRVEARDILGFKSTLDTFVVIAFPAVRRP
jgi:hypothetical protein